MSFVFVSVPERGVKDVEEDPESTRYYTPEIKLYVVTFQLPASLVEVGFTAELKVIIKVFYPLVAGLKSHPDAGLELSENGLLIVKDVPELLRAHDGLPTTFKPLRVQVKVELKLVKPEGNITSMTEFEYKFDCSVNETL